MYKLFYIIVIFMFNGLIQSVHAQEYDPTKPLSYSASITSDVALSALKLQTIVHGKSDHTAVINGQIVKVGDMVQTYTLVAVNNNSVVLRNSEETLTLNLFASVIKKNNEKN